ncbi:MULTISPECIES: XRE family transcriptional regulator [Nostocales]|uniref:XRE family transcriptional regulator n=1 Tax=Nostocales TaxID=1161 RepID=UPI00168381CC|nr:MULTISPECIES: XRE family transcriptional regulator [Nostocales]MBD2298191.1 XRE family transcriptional regulator [Nostoc sp. FACHB-190]MBD2489375.1 XRE family transcriptional regulator [Aulosira sp. FACHB-615]
MIPLLNRQTEQQQLHTYQTITSRIFTVSSSTTASRENISRNLVAGSEITTSGVILPSSPEATQKAVNELKRLSGLTWDQLAKLFNVSRRSLHSWASGERLNSFNEYTLNQLLGMIQYIDRGSASLNRSLLLQPGSNGIPLIDLLVVGNYEEVKQILGSGNAPHKPKLGALSEEERRLRMPLPPDVLANSLPDISYHQTGRSRPAQAARSRRNSSGQ